MNPAPDLAWLRIKPGPRPQDDVASGAAALTTRDGHDQR